MVKSKATDLITGDVTRTVHGGETETVDPPILPLRKQGESAISSPEAADGETSPLKISKEFLTERPGFEPGVEVLAPTTA